MSLIFVDCEAGPNPRLKAEGRYYAGTSPYSGVLSEFGAVEYETGETFHGVIYESKPSKENPAVPEIGQEINDPYQVFKEFAKWIEEVSQDKPVFISDNPAYDWQWISFGFDSNALENPFGHSGRRIGDFYAGVVGDWKASSKWKRLRDTKHTHHPVDDAMGNFEAFKKIEELNKNCFRQFSGTNLGTK